MMIVRVKKDAKYFSASNEPFNDKRLSWEARGLMGYLLSKPNDWEVRMSDLDNQGPAGSRKLKRMLAELRACGYMNRIRTKLPDGKFEWTTEVYESPTQNPNPSKGIISASGAKCTSAIPTSAKPLDILSTESQSTESDDDERRVTRANLFKVYGTEIGIITPFIADSIEDWLKEGCPPKWIEDAMREAAIQNKRGWKYCEAILKRWMSQGNQNPIEKNTPVRKNGEAKQSKVDAAIAAFLANHREDQPHV